MNKKITASAMGHKYKTIDRDVSWMYFNHRILEEARKESVPVLERTSFLGIYSNNLDEFFRVRIAGMDRAIRFSEPRTKREMKERWSLMKIRKEIQGLNTRYIREYQQAVEEVVEALRKENIHIVGRATWQRISALMWTGTIDSMCLDTPRRDGSWRTPAWTARATTPRTWWCA